SPSFANRPSSVDKTQSRSRRKHSPPFFSLMFPAPACNRHLDKALARGWRQVRAEHQRAWIGRIQISQRWTHIKVYSSKAGGFHPHALFREFEQRRETRFGETEMVNADRRQRQQRLIKTGKLGRIDIQLRVPAHQFMNAPRHAL